jgi:hypothetical protein
MAKKDAVAVSHGVRHLRIAFHPKLVGSEIAQVFGHPEDLLTVRAISSGYEDRSECAGTMG